MAHMIVDPKVFLQRVVRQSLMLSVGLTVFLFFILSKATGPAIIILIFPLCFVLSFVFFSNEPLVQIRRRAKEIDSEILFATRFMILKIESGVPLFNAFIDASDSYGVAGKYFKEIVDEINLGKPIEKAVEEARGSLLRRKRKGRAGLGESRQRVRGRHNPADLASRVGERGDNLVSYREIL